MTKIESIINKYEVLLDEKLDEYYKAYQETRLDYRLKLKNPSSSIARAEEGIEDIFSSLLKESGIKSNVEFTDQNRDNTLIDVYEQEKNKVSKKKTELDDAKQKDTDSSRSKDVVFSRHESVQFGFWRERIYFYFNILFCFIVLGIMMKDINSETGAITNVVDKVKDAAKKQVPVVNKDKTKDIATGQPKPEVVPKPTRNINTNQQGITTPSFTN
jgi:hypothetical protein